MKKEDNYVLKHVHQGSLLHIISKAFLNSHVLFHKYLISPCEIYLTMVR